MWAGYAAARPLTHQEVCVRVFITGCAGFIASRLAKALLARGDQVVGIDNLNDYYPLEHKRRNLSDLTGTPGFSFVQMDICNYEGLTALFDQHRFDAVAHIAAMASVRYSVAHPLLYGSVNVQGSINVLEAARLHGAPHCLLASTGSVYGRSTPVPFKETAAADMPLAAYPASKRSMELMGHSFAHLWNMPVTVLRFFNVYGPHGRPDMMPWQWTLDILAGRELTLYDAGNLKRDWTYIDDLLAGFIAALAKPNGFQIYNLGCGNPVANIDFVKTLEQLLGKPARFKNVPAPASEPPITFADITKARTELGYHPKVLAPEGLQRFIAWLRREHII